MKLFLGFASLSLAMLAHGTEWFASPLASPTGAGSKTNPWPLKVALAKNTVIQPGDTLYLRGGHYVGNFKSSLNNCTVRSYPNEWAVISDGNAARLTININAATNQATFSGGTYWSAGQTIIIDSETMQLDVVAGIPVTWRINRGWGGTTAVSHSSNAVVILKSPIIETTGSNVIWRDFEITSLLSTNRTVGTNWWLPAGLNLLATGAGNKAVNLIIHDTGHPGIGFWQQGAGGEINGCLIWGVGMNDYSPDYAGGVGTPRGSAIYSQNAQSGFAQIKNCINFRNFTSGGKVYGETGPVLNFGFFSNIVFQVNPTIEGSSGSTSTSNLWFSGNVMLGTPMLSYVSLSNRSTFFINNQVINGAFVLDETAYSYLTNNFVLMPKNAGALTSPIHYHSTHYPTNALNLVWDYNTYYLGNGSSPAQWTFKSLDWPQSAVTNSAGGGILNYQNDSGKAWTNWSSFDAHSTYQEGWPANYLKVSVHASDYDTNRWHVAVVSTSGQTSTAITLSDYGFVNGQRYQLVDAQNWPVVIASGTYGGGTISLPLNLSNVSDIKGTTSQITNEHTNVKNPGLFNAFVLTRVQGLLPPSNLHPLTP